MFALQTGTSIIYGKSMQPKAFLFVFKTYLLYSYYIQNMELVFSFKIYKYSFVSHIKNLAIYNVLNIQKKVVKVLVKRQGSKF